MESTAKRSSWIAGTGLLVLAVTGVALATQLPSALKDGERTRMATAVERQVASVRTQTAETTSKTTKASADLATQNTAIDDAAAQAAALEKQLAKQRKRIRNLHEEIKALSG